MSDPATIGAGVNAGVNLAGSLASLFGSGNPVHDIPKLLGMYQAGKLKLDELITKRYTLDQINEGYQDLLDGKNIRGVLVHEH